MKYFLKKYPVYFLIFIMGVICLYSREAFCFQWTYEKSNHFIIQYPSYEKVSWVKNIAREAERYYTQIADDIGYARYGDFWTWDNRVKILIYPDKQTFVSETGQPPWSSGGAIRDDDLIRTKEIVTYKQEGHFIQGVLPHEISHLVLREFVGFDKNIPLWFEEGVAQLREKDKKEKADWIMRKIVKAHQHIPLNEFSRRGVRDEKDLGRVTVFYAQSISIINFLISRYGSRDFGEMCQFIRRGKSFETAIKGAYSTQIKSLQDLENKWVRYMSR